jgi:hypothetical protein
MAFVIEVLNGFRHFVNDITMFGTARAVTREEAS